MVHATWSNLRCSRGSIDGHDLDLISCDDLCNEGWLVDNESSLEFFDALAAGLETLLQSHIMSVVLVQDGVDEVAGVAVSALGHLLKCAQVVHPVKLGAFLDLIVATHEHVDLEGLT